MENCSLLLVDCRMKGCVLYVTMGLRLFYFTQETHMQPQTPKRRGCLARILRWIVFAFLILIALVVIANLTRRSDRTGVTSSPTTSPISTNVPPTARPWYSGGTLHNKTVADWQAATDADKLATSADWLVAGLDIDVSKYSDAELKILATSMQDCVEQLSQPVIENHLITTTVASVAALCATTMEKELPVLKK